PAHLIAWRDVIEHGAEAALARAPAAPAIVRIDAAGQDAAVERALIRRGHDALIAERGAALGTEASATIPDERGRILAPRQHYLGFAAVLAELDRASAARPHWRVQQPPSAIAE